MASVQPGDCVSRAYGSARSTSRHASRGAGLIAELIEGHGVAVDAAHRRQAALSRAETSAPVPPDPPAPDPSVALPAEELAAAQRYLVNAYLSAYNAGRGSTRQRQALS